MLTQSYLRQLEAETVERYSRRFRQFGKCARSLGWDTEEHQRVRFGAAIELAEFSGQHVLDIGCGFGDFYGFLKECGAEPASYRGIDINSSLLSVARNEWPDARFERRNLMTEPFDRAECDVAVMFGLLNFRLSDVSNYDYAAEMIKGAWSACRKALVFDALSSYRSPDYPAEDFVFYYEPERLLGIAARLSSNVVLKHDYPPIPQKEFMIAVKK